MPVSDAALEERVRALGTWFHNLRLGEGGSVATAPEHALGDFPSNFWRYFQRVVPSDLRGLSVLDVGCNGGFYSFEMKRRGARRVLAVDHDDRYLAQARFARDQLGLDVELRKLDVYDLDDLGSERFDWVLFLGVFYHLRHPLYALEKVAQRVRGRLLFQTMERGASDGMDMADDYPFDEDDIFLDPRFPAMFFIERTYAGDRTNWWIPNAPASAALLRSVGMEVIERPCREVYVCRPRAEQAASGPGREAGA